MNENIKEYYHLTHPQKRIWYTAKINTNSQLHNIGGCLRIKGKIKIEQMEKAINLLIASNEGLRLRFKEKDSSPFQYVEEYRYQTIEFIDFSRRDMPVDRHEEWVKNEFECSFKLEDSNLYKFIIYMISEKEYGVLVKLHHGICDGWGIALVQKQICEIYDGLSTNCEFSLGNVHSYLEYIEAEQEYMNSDKFIKNRNFWNEKFSNLSQKSLYSSSESLNGNRMSFLVPRDLSKKIHNYIKGKNCSLNTFFIAITLIYLNKSTKESELIIGTPVFNRTSREQKTMVGMFTNTLPFEFTINSEINMAAFIKQINRELKQCFVNQKYPYDLLIQDLKLGKRGYDSLFKVSVNYYNSNYANEVNGVEAEADEYYCGHQSYSLQLIVKELIDQKIQLDFDYKTLEYTDAQIKTMQEYMVNIIQQVIEAEEITIEQIKYVNEEDAFYKKFELNSTTQEYPKKTIYELFENQVKKTPNKVALEFGDQALTYRELNDAANQFSNFLIEKGISRQSIVAIMETHSIDLLISILGVLKAGAAYVPIDSSYPIERINYMLEDSKSNLLLTNFEADENINFEGSIINVSTINLDKYSSERLRNETDLHNLVYIIYTSGSTGKPKGVMITHAGLTNYICWANRVYLNDENDSMALYSSISFDLTVTSIFTPLISGHSVIIYENDENEFVLYKILRENKASVVKLTPAHLTLLKELDNTSSSIKRFIVGGEDLKVSLASEVLNSFGGDLEIFNEYGPTETVVGCMTYLFNKKVDKGSSVPIGCPADNVQIYILDDQLDIVPTGFVGEIYVSGDGVARGYLNREGLTKERFIENPFVKGRKMYKTGDLARYLENGMIEYLGRMDNQVKIRGHRVEIGEVERYLLEHEKITDAIVVFKKDVHRNDVMCAYLVSKTKCEIQELKTWILQFLPKYMVPSNFIFLDKIPLTLNGKVNHHLLPESIQPENKGRIDPSTLVEKELVEAMGEILGFKNISMNDNYYQLGGDSIKAIQISSKLKDKGLDLRVKDILDFDTMKEIAATVVESNELRSINQETANGVIKPTPIVEWFFQQDFANPSLYNQHVFMEYSGKLNIDMVSAAMQQLIYHHDALRLNYNQSSDRLYYNNEHLNENLSIEYVDLSQYSSHMHHAHIETFCKQNLNIESSHLFNVTLFDLGSTRQVLLFRAHHLIVDGVSWRIILDDFLTLLNQLSNQKEVKLPMKTHSFKEWAEALEVYSQQDFGEEGHYWQSIIDKDAAYPVDFNEEEDTVETANIIYKEVDKVLLQDLITKPNEVYNLELNETLTIALALTLNDLTHKNDMIIELERHGREWIDDKIDVSRTVGWFTSMYPANLILKDDDVNQKIKSLKEQLRSIPSKGFHYGILKLLKSELKDRGDKHIRFNYLGDIDTIVDGKRIDLSKIKFGLMSDGHNALTSLIDIDAMVIRKQLVIHFTYSRNRFDDTTIQKLSDGFIDTLKLIVEKCANTTVKELTPSDFDAAGLSQEELDSLFD